MATLNRRWNGHAYGTNIGNLYTELLLTGDNVTGELRFNDRDYGPAVYDLTGTFQDGRLSFTGTSRQQAPGVQLGVLTAEAALSANGSLQGVWTTDIGTGGTFRLFPHDDLPISGKTPAEIAEQMHTKSQTLGTLRLYRRDLDELIGFVRKDFTIGRVIVTYSVHGNDVTVYAEDLLKNYPAETDLRFLKIQVQEPDAHGINKVVNVDLIPGGENVVRVQGVSESWVNGKAHVLVSQLQKYRRIVLTNYRKTTGAIAVLFLAAVFAVSPDVTPLSRRTIFISCVVAVWFLGAVIHRRFIPNVLIFGGEKQPGFLSQWRASVGSLIVNLLTALATAWLLLFFGPQNLGSTDKPANPPKMLDQNKLPVAK